ncbi:MAG: sulfurtransferase TusA family protein [Gammaproteobacteria bacterium]
MTDTTLDARGLLCPMPVIRTQDALQKLRPGQTLRVSCTDPGVLHDIPAWCRVHGHRVLDIQEGGDEIVIRILVCNSG